MRAIAIVLLIAAVGCAGMTRGQVLDRTIAIGGDVLACAAGEHDTVMSAIRGGGADWLSIAIAAFQCLPSVIRGIEAQQAIAMAIDPLGVLIADASDAAPASSPPPPPLSKGGKRRLAVAKVFSTLLTRNVHQ